jgi:Phycobilisome protein
MLKQLERLSLTAEGRYATTQELQFIRDYLPTVDLRLSAYQKIAAAEAEIIDQLEARMRAIQPDILQIASGDISSLYQRDTRSILRSAIAAMLTDDLDRVREHLLLWHRTILKAFKVQHIAVMAHKTMPEIIQQFLTPEEFAIVLPFLQLNQAVLAN